MNSSQCWDVEATRHLFDRFSATELESLTPVGYTCGEYLFRWINWKEHRFAQQDTSNFTVLELPLSGVDTIWQVALRTRDADVGQRAAGFLTQVRVRAGVGLTLNPTLTLTLTLTLSYP